MSIYVSVHMQWVVSLIPLIITSHISVLPVLGSAKAIFSEHAGVKKAWLQKPRAQATSGMRLVQVDVEGRTDGARICVPAWNAVVTAKSEKAGPGL